MVRLIKVYDDIPISRFSVISWQHDWMWEESLDWWTLHPLSLSLIDVWKSQHLRWVLGHKPTLVGLGLSPEVKELNYLTTDVVFTLKTILFLIMLNLP